MKNKNIKEQLIALVNMQNEVFELEQRFINKWTEAIDSKKMVSKEADDIYSDIVERLSKNSNLIYNKYYDLVHSILNDEKIDKIQKKINYNFMSLDFINELEKEF